ncbi:MAG: hypothetical protein P8X74_13265 [Reinekea sp.]
MDRFNWISYNIIDHYNSQAPQEDGQHAFQPDTGQTSAGVADHYYDHYNHHHHHYNGQAPQEDGQHTFRPETGQTSAGGAASGSYPAPGRPYLDLNTSAQIPSSDWEYLLPQPIAVEDTIQNDAPLAPSNSRPAVEVPRRKARKKGKSSIKERFLEGLEAYARGAPMTDCAPTLQFNNYISTDGTLVRRGIPLYEEFTSAEKTRLDQAIIARQGAKLIQLADNDTVKERFLAALDMYAQGVKLVNCSATLSLKSYVSDDGHLHKAGNDLCAGLSLKDQERVNRALAARGRKYAQHISGDVGKFMTTLEPYANGLPLEECRKLPGLKRKASIYLTPEGGLTHKGKRLIENLHPGQLDKVSDAIAKRQQYTELNPQVPKPSRQQPEMFLSMPEMGWMDQAASGTWGIAAESAEPFIPHYGGDVVGMDFQHRYDSNGLMPQSAPDRLIARGIEDRMLINILGEEYRVHYTGSSGNPTNENPYGNKFMLVPRMRGG